MRNSVLNIGNNNNIIFSSVAQKQNTLNKGPVWPKEFSQFNTSLLQSRINTQETKKQITVPQKEHLSEDKFIKQTELSEQQNDATAKAAGTAVILKGAQACIEKLSQFCARMLMRGKEFTHEDDVKKVADAMKAKHGLKAEIHYIDNANKDILKNKFPMLSKALDTVASGGNAFYTDKGNFAVAPKSKPSLILHELGHAINSEKSKIFGGLQKLRIVGSYAPMALLFLNSISGKQKDGKESFIERHAGTIGFCSFLPTIIEEGAASFRGIKAAKKVLPNVKLGALKRNYFFAWMTYLLAGVGIGIASKLMFAERKLDNSKNKNS